MDIFNKIDELRKKYPDEESMVIVSDWEKRVKVASLTSNLKNNDAFKILIDRYEDEIIKIKKELYSNPKLFENEEGIILGRLLYARMKWCKEFLDIFNIAEKQVEGVNNLIDNKLLNE